MSRQSSKTSKPHWRTGTRVVVCKRGQGPGSKAEMQIAKPALSSHGFWIVLAIAFCISLGILIGFHGGLHNEAGAIYDSSGGRHAIAGREEIRLYGAFVLLGILGVTALATLARFVGGIFAPRRKHHRSAAPSRSDSDQ